MCAFAIVFSLLSPWLSNRLSHLANILVNQKINGEILASLLTGILLTPAAMLFNFGLAAQLPWAPVLIVTLAIVSLASIADAHPMRLIFLISPLVITMVTTLSWKGDSFDLALALLMTTVIFATVIWLRQRHRVFMTALVARVNEQMIPIRLERLMAADKSQLEQLTTANRSAWQDFEQPIQSIASLAHRLEGSSSVDAPTARTLARISQHMADRVKQQTNFELGASGTHSANTDWVSITKLTEMIRLRMVSLTQSSGARLHFVPVSADIETVPALVERVLQNLIVHSIVEAGAGSISLQARFVGQSLTLSVEHDGDPPATHLLIADQGSEGLPRALALAEDCELPLRIDECQRISFTLSFDQWRRHPSRTIHPPRAFDTDWLDTDTSVKCRTLLIDDDPLARMGLAALLEKSGYDTIIWSGQSTEAIESELAEANISFIVSDWWLSKNANAIAMLNWVQTKLPEPVPVVIVSGDQSCLDPTAISAQLDDVTVRTLAKPVTPKTLERAISGLIELDQDLG